MSSNYFQYLRYELKMAEKEADILNREAARRERLYSAATEHRKACERKLGMAVVAESENKESFRRVHTAFSNVRQRIGELQSEIDENYGS